MQHSLILKAFCVNGFRQTFELFGDNILSESALMLEYLGGRPVAGVHLVS